MQEGSFDAAVEGATYVFHTASPYLSPDKIQDGMKEVVEPALGGTTNVFSSVAKHRDTIKRVVITSSIAGQSHDCVCFNVSTHSCILWQNLGPQVAYFRMQ